MFDIEIENDMLNDSEFRAEYDESIDPWTNNPEIINYEPEWPWSFI